MIRQVYSIRGATTVDRNDKDDIIARSVELIAEIVKRNGLNDGEISVTDCLVSTTADITAFYPARAIRESGLIDAPLFSMTEPAIDGALPLCIRVMVRMANRGRERRAGHVYLHGAKALRPDLAETDRKE